MSFADDYYAGTYETTTSTIGATHYYYVKKFLDTIKEMVRLVPLGLATPLPEGNGKSVVWDRWTQLARSISNATLSEGVMPNATSMTLQQLSATVAEYGAWVQLSTLVDQSIVSRNTAGAVDVVASHAAEIIDMLTHREIGANGGYPMRADYATDTGASFSNVVDSATSTTLVDAELTSNTDYGDANDDLNQSVVIITSGTGYGQARAVTDYVASSGSMTISPAWDVTPAAGDTYTVVTFDGIASGDKLTYAILAHVRARLAANKAMRIGGTNGYYLCVADSFQLEALQADSLWQNVSVYNNGGTDVYKGEVGKLGGFRFIEETNPFKFPITTRGTAGTSYGPGATGANQAETGSGLVTLTPFFGQAAYGVTSFKKKNPQKPPVYIKDSSALGQPIPRFGSIGWMIEFVAKALNPMWCVNVATYDMKPV